MLSAVSLLLYIHHLKTETWLVIPHDAIPKNSIFTNDCTLGLLLIKVPLIPPTFPQISYTPLRSMIKLTLMRQ